MISSKLANREELRRFLRSIEIGIHLLFAGALTKQPDCRKVTLKIVGDIRSSESLMNRVFWVGTYPALTNPMPDFIAESIKEFMAKASR